jgi:quercetin dioxygenase-like cupin family protein
MEPTAHRWSALTPDAPMPLLTRTRVIGEKVMLSRVELARGCFVPTHSHANEQMAVILSGSLRFGLGPEGQSQRFQTVRAGEVMHLPAGCPHSAEALEDTVVLDVFSPPSATTGVDVGRR